MTSHTPGPWVFKPAEVEDDGSVYPARIDGGARELVIVYLLDMSSDAMAESAGDVRSKAANVRLITAAPDLLEALQRLAGMLSGDSMSAQDRRDAYEIADAAIAKATGAPQ